MRLRERILKACLSYERIGDHDLSVMFVLRDLQELFSVTEKFYKIGGLEKVQIHAAPVIPQWAASIFAPCLFGQ